jgi:hypothetical protein
MARRTAVVYALAATVVAPATMSADLISQASTRMETQDDLLVRVEKRAPGFGGMFFDSDGQLVLYLLDTSQLPAARSAVEAVFGADWVPTAGLRAVQGQYTVSQLAAWTRRASAVLQLKGVALVDLDEARNRLAIGVENRSQVTAVKKALASLKVPRAAVVIDVTGAIRPVDRR